jgi:hypothetical protein
MSRDLNMTPKRLTYAEEKELLIMDQFRCLSQEQGQAIISEATQNAKKIVLDEDGFTNIIQLSNNNSVNRNFEDRVNEIDVYVLRVISEQATFVLKQMVKNCDSGPLKRCLTTLENKVSITTEESPSASLDKLINAGDNHFFSPLDGLSTSAAISRKFKLMIKNKSDFLDVDWKREHTTNFIDNLCIKKLGASFIRLVKGTLIIYLFVLIIFEISIFQIFRFFICLPKCLQPEKQKYFIKCTN